MTLAAGDPRHGTANGYSNLRCRCRPCKDAWARYVRERPATADYRYRKGHIPRDEWLALIAPKHGTTTRYKNGCRCHLCREASRISRALRRHEVTNGYRAVGEHGKPASYANGCRCDECREAHRVKTAEYRRARLAARTAPSDAESAPSPAKGMESSSEWQHTPS